jgi:hypothetical protein
LIEFSISTNKENTNLLHVYVELWKKTFLGGFAQLKRGRIFDCETAPVRVFLYIITPPSGTVLLIRSLSQSDEYETSLYCT